MPRQTPVQPGHLFGPTWDARVIEITAPARGIRSGESKMGAATNVVGTCGALCLFIGTNRLAPSWLRRGRVFRRMSLVDTTPSAPPPHTQPRGGAFLATTATRHHRQLGPKSETWDRVSGLGPCPDGSLWAEGHPESPRRSRREPPGCGR